MCSFSAAGAVGKRTRPLSGITENARGWKRRYLATFLNMRKVCASDRGRSAKSISGCSAVGSAPALGAGCRRFESCHSDQILEKPPFQAVFLRFRCAGIGIPQLSVLLYTAPAMMEPYRKGRCGSCFTTANEVIGRSFIRKAVFSSAVLTQRPPFAAITTSTSASGACRSISAT